jgi:hypothetical protein
MGAATFDSQGIVEANHDLAIRASLITDHHYPTVEAVACDGEALR